MTEPKVAESALDQDERQEKLSYAIGFAYSLVLTVIAFASVFAGLPTAIKIVIIGIAAILQVIVHMRRFLHLGLADRQSREDLLLVLFSGALLAIMAGGSMWILGDLQHRMHDGSPVLQEALPEP